MLINFLAALMRLKSHLHDTLKADFNITINHFLGTFANCEEWQLSLQVPLPVCQSAWYNSGPTWRIFMKFNIWELLMYFYVSCRIQNMFVHIYCCMLFNFLHYSFVLGKTNRYLRRTMDWFFEARSDLQTQHKFRNKCRSIPSRRLLIRELHTSLMNS
jgi:hypothetical protein